MKNKLTVMWDKILLRKPLLQKPSMINSKTSARLSAPGIARPPISVSIALLLFVPYFHLTKKPVSKTP
ncbi:MAG: hypothetical protein AAGA18_09605 [Verrucomicrobiota bacterium]